MSPASPTVAARELGMRLRDAREEVGMSGIKAAKSLGISQNFLSEVEHGKRRLAQAKLEEAVSLFAVPDQDRHELLDLRDQTDQRGWWVEYTGLFAPDTIRYFGYEWGAESIQTHESLLIPGLLQTEAYAHAVVTGDVPNTRTSEADQRVRARMMRKRRLHDIPVKLTALINEGALEQRVGGSDVMNEQLQHLIDLTDELPDTLAVHVVPFSAGANGVLGQSTFHILDFVNPRLPKLAWQETVTSFGVLDSRAQVRQYEASFQASIDHAAPRKASQDLIRDKLKKLT